MRVSLAQRGTKRVEDLAAPLVDPTVEDGAHGVNFIFTSVRSHAEGGWVSGAYTP